MPLNESRPSTRDDGDQLEAHMVGSGPVPQQAVGPEIVGDVKLWKEVAVDVAGGHSQTPPLGQVAWQCVGDAQ